MSLLRLGPTGVHRIDLEILRETQNPLAGGLTARAGRDHTLGMTPSPGRSLSCAGASHRPRDAAEPTISGLSRPEIGPARGSGTLIISHSQVSE